MATITAELLDLLGSPRALDRARRDLLATRAQLNETLQELTSDRRTVVDLSTRVALLTPPAVVLAGDWTRRSFWVDEPGPVALPDSAGVDARVLLSWIWLRAWLDLLERSVERTAPASVQLVRDPPRRWWQREGAPNVPAEVSPAASPIAGEGTPRSGGS